MSEQFTYEKAGVSILSGNKLVDLIKKTASQTHRPGVLGGLGGFAACFELPFQQYRHPVLVSSTDGVGTKLRLAIDLNIHHTIGIDLVAMCVNDLVVMGAEPLFFLDYFATGQLELTRAKKIIDSIALGCQQANVALIGGETAEMPDMYAKGDYDLAGFTVGLVEKEDIVTGANIIPGDVLVALPSSGPHSNGYALIRHILKAKGISLTQPFEGKTLGEVLLTPTRIYVKSLLPLYQAKLLKGAAHITGGGLIENIPRILPAHCAAVLNMSSYTLPPIFEWLQTTSKITDQEMRRTFNCGIGMVLCIEQAQISQAMQILHAHGEHPWILGHIQSFDSITPQVVFSDA